MKDVIKKAWFGLNDLGSVAMVLVVGVVSLIIGAKVVQDINGTMTAGSAGANASIQAGSLFTNLTGQLPLLGTIVGLGLVIGVLVGAFMYFRR